MCCMFKACLYEDYNEVDTTFREKYEKETEKRFAEFVLVAEKSPYVNMVTGGNEDAHETGDGGD